MSSQHPKFHVFIGVHETGLTRRNDPNAAAADEEFDNELKTAVRRRDKSRCQACGLAVKFDPEHAYGLEIHHIDHNHANNQMDNLVLLCPMCHQILTLSEIARSSRIESKIMKLIYLPQISQEDLNLLSWGLAVTLYRCSKADKNDETVLHVLKNTESIITEILNCNVFPDNYFNNNEETPKIIESINNDMSLLGEILLQIKKKDIKQYNCREQWLRGARIFFNPEDHFADMFGGIVPQLSESDMWSPGPTWTESWKSIAETINANLLQDGDLTCGKRGL